MSPEEKSITYTPTRADILAFQLHAIIRNRLLIVLGCIVFFLVVLSFIGHQTTPPVSFLARFLAGIIGGLFAIFIAAIVGFLFAVVTVWTGKFKNVLAPQTTAIKEEGLTSSSAAGEGILRWIGIHKVHSTSKLLLIYTNETTARIIPKRFFSNPEAASTFEQEIRARMKSSQVHNSSV